MSIVAVTGGFDDLRARQMRFLQEAARLGSLHVRLWSDEMIAEVNGVPPKFPVEERLYFLQSIRFVSNVCVAEGHTDPDALPEVEGIQPDVWAMSTAKDSRMQFCKKRKMRCVTIDDKYLGGFPLPHIDASVSANRKKVLVTGCYDWLHTGHVRFFEEVSEYGDLYAVVGHDTNIRLLKGPGHPQFSQAQRLYMVAAVRFVHQAYVSTGDGWMDAEPEIQRIQPDIYAVNEDGDRPEKRDFCKKNGIEYLVLKRLPKEGLPRRQSKVLRGF